MSGWHSGPYEPPAFPEGSISAEIKRRRRRKIIVALALVLILLFCFTSGCSAMQGRPPELCGAIALVAFMVFALFYLIGAGDKKR